MTLKTSKENKTIYEYEIYIKSGSNDYIVVKSGNYEEIQLEWEEDSERRPDRYIGSFESLESPSSVEKSYDSNDTDSLYDDLARYQAINFSEEFIADLRCWNDDNIEGWREYLEEKWDNSEIYGHFFVMSEYARNYPSDELEAFIAAECFKRGLSSCLEIYGIKLEIAREKFPHFFV